MSKQNGIKQWCSDNKDSLKAWGLIAGYGLVITGVSHVVVKTMVNAFTKEK